MNNNNHDAKLLMRNTCWFSVYMQQSRPPNRDAGENSLFLSKPLLCCSEVIEVHIIIFQINLLLKISWDWNCFLWRLEFPRVGHNQLNIFKFITPKYEKLPDTTLWPVELSNFTHSTFRHTQQCYLSISSFAMFYICINNFFFNKSFKR